MLFIDSWLTHKNSTASTDLSGVCTVTLDDHITAGIAQKQIFTVLAILRQNA